MKIQLKPQVLPRLTFAKYVRLLAVSAKKIQTSDTPTDCVIFLNHEFPDPKFKGKPMPLMLIGEISGEWRKMFNERKQTDANIGQCTVNAEDKTLNLTITKGKKIKTEAIKRLNLVFRQARMKLNIQESLEEETSGESVASAAAAGASTVSNKKPQVTEERIQEVQGQLEERGKELGVQLTAYQNKFKRIQSEVIPKLRAEKSSTKDLRFMQDVIKEGDEFVANVKKESKPLQKSFNKQTSEIERNKKTLLKLASAVKARKKSFAQRLADAYFKKAEKREATNKEIDQMQASLKLAFDYRKINSLEKEERKIHLKAIFATAQLRGPLFRMEDTDKVYARLAA